MVFTFAPWTQHATSTYLSGETVLFDPDPTWWQSVSVSLAGAAPLPNASLPASHYNFSLLRYGKPPPSFDVPVSSAGSEVIASRQQAYNASSVYLNTGSALTVNWTNAQNVPVSLWVFRGRRSFQAWKNAIDTNKKGWPNTGKAVLFASGVAGSARLKVAKSAPFYFVWGCANARCPQQVSVATRLTGAVRQFNLTGARSRTNCTSTRSCTIPLDRTSGQVVVLAMPPATDDGPLLAAKFKTTIEGRADFYWPLFICGAWGVLSLISIYILCCACICSDHRNYENID